MHPHDLLSVAPQWHTRRLTAAEVIRLWQGDPVPGVNPRDPRVRAIRRCIVGNIGRTAFAVARHSGYLYLNRAQHHDDDGDPDRLRALWGWWCAGAGHPEVVLERGRGSDAVRVRCDLSPTGRVWNMAAFGTVARLLAPHRGHPGAGWLFTADVLEVDGLDMESGISIARGLVDLGTAGRFLRNDRPPPEPPVMPRPERSAVPIERTGRAG